MAQAFGLGRGVLIGVFGTRKLEFGVASFTVKFSASEVRGMTSHDSHGAGSRIHPTVGWFPVQLVEEKLSLRVDVPAWPLQGASYKRKVDSDFRSANGPCENVLEAAHGDWGSHWNLRVKIGPPIVNMSF
jgi:hypothetical protein